MTTNEYLKEVLESQKLANDSEELKELQKHRADVEQVLRSKFPKCSPTIRYGGAKAKGTLILAAYDLDIICYFPKGDASAGESLEDIYNNTKKALENDYLVSPKTSSLRLKSKDAPGLVRDFHIDVVPGRYVDSDDGDCFIYQANAEKTRLKTNIEVHVSHVKDSGVTDAIKLLKFWKYRKTLHIKQFVWELLIIKSLQGKSSDSLAEQLLHVWTEINAAKDPIPVEDPANPAGNDLSGVLAENWTFLTNAAKATLDTVENAGWEAVFGKAKRVDSNGRIAELTKAASAASIITKPWAQEAA